MTAPKDNEALIAKCENLLMHYERALVVAERAFKGLVKLKDEVPNSDIAIEKCEREIKALREQQASLASSIRDLRGKK